METHTHTASDFTTYKGVIINNIRNAATGSDKIVQRAIEVTYIADKWSEGGEATIGTTSLARAHAMIEWLLENGSTVEANRIVTTIGDMETCTHGCRVRNIAGYSKFLKGTK
jgi:hypothetical protein